MKALVDVFQTKFKEAVKVQEDHTRKMAKENQLLRAKLTTLIKKGRPSIASSESNPIPSRVEGDSIWVGDLDLMTLVPDSGPSSFGRTVAAAAFGEGDKCKLINERIGPKLSKKAQKLPAMLISNRSSEIALLETSRMTFKLQPRRRFREQTSMD